MSKIHVVTAVILKKNSEVDRLKLRELIFSNPSKKKDLENIIHPIVRESISNFITTSSSSYSIIMVPLIFETKSQKNYDRIITVDCEIPLQVLRASKRDDQNEIQIESIIDNEGQTIAWVPIENLTSYKFPAANDCILDKIKMI